MMNGVLYSLAGFIILLSVLQIFADFFLKYVFKDARTNEHKRLRKGLLCMTLALLVITQGVTVLTNIRRDAKAEGERKNFTTQISGLNTNQFMLQKRIQDLEQTNRKLLSALATNSTISPETRLAIIDAKRKTEAIRS